MAALFSGPTWALCYILDLAGATDVGAADKSMQWRQQKILQIILLFIEVSKVQDIFFLFKGFFILFWHFSPSW